MNRVRDELEQRIIDSGYLDNAPFKWVSLIIREGLKDELEPHYERISPKYGDLPLAIEIDTHRLLGADDDVMATVFKKATVLALLHAGEKYGLETEGLQELEA